MAAAERLRAQQERNRQLRESQQQPLFAAATGRKITDFYDVAERRPVGVGSFGQVFRAVERSSGKPVAIKAILKSNLEKQGEQLKREVAILQRVQSDYIVRLFDLFEDQFYVYLIMEFMGGDELFRRITTIYPHGYNERVASGVIRRVLLGVAYLHENSIVHRDLKPENLMYASPNDDVDVKISDFGLARIVENGVVVRTACGSPSYVAPEVLQQAQSQNGYGCAVDVWSIGVITYVLLCGYLPFYHQHTPTLFSLITAGRYTFASPHWDHVSPVAKDFVSRLLVVDPAERWTAHQALQHQWIQAPPDAGPTVPGVRRQAHNGAPPDPAATVPGGPVACGPAP